MEASNLFTDINNRILEKREIVQFIEADGINYLALADKKYDMIVCDIIHPDDAGAGALYSLEFYESCRNKLENEGLFVQWLLLDQLAPKDLSIILATFYKIFPDMQLYFGQEQSQFQKLMLLGYKNEDFFSLQKISENLDHLKFASELKGKKDHLSFFSFFITSGSALANNLASISPNSQDRPIIEYQSPKHRWQPAKGILNLKYLNSLREPVSQYLELNMVDMRNTENYFTVRSLIIEGRLAEFSGNYEQAYHLYSKASLADVDTFLVSELLANIAWKFTNKNRFDLAVNSFKKAIATDHSNTAASFSLAELLSRLNRVIEAAHFFQYTVRYDPQNFHAYRRLGDLSTNRQNFDQAFDYYQRSAQINSQQPVLFYILGQIYFHHKKDYIKAIRSYQMSLELDPFHAYHKQAINALKELEPLIN